MSVGSKQWGDLRARVLAGLAMVVVGFGCIVLGGHIFHLLVALVCGLMAWELSGMLRPGVRHLQLQMGAMMAVIVLISIYLPVWLALPILLIPALAGVRQPDAVRFHHIKFALLIALAGYAMMFIRDTYGFGWLMWLVLIVVVTDVAGYFAGRLIGGPKFWPAISPKKTWSGTIAGWVGAALVGLFFSINSGLGVLLIVFSILLSFASQMGDIAESSLKRQMGVKDSSDLIPGHGGLLDRFDGMLAAAVIFFVLGLLAGFPPGFG